MSKARKRRRSDVHEAAMVLLPMYVDCPDQNRGARMHLLALECQPNVQSLLLTHSTLEQDTWEH